MSRPAAAIHGRPEGLSRCSLVGGAAAFAWVGLAALAIGVLEWLATGRPFGVRLAAKLAGLYLGAFHGAGIRLRSDLPTVGIADAPALPWSEITVQVTFLLGTGVAGAMLWRAGRRAGRAAGGGWLRRIAWGASIAPVYAVSVAAVALTVVLRLPSAGSPEVRVDPPAAGVFALLLAVVAGGAGGGRAAAEAGPPSGPWGTRLVSWLVGGWWMTMTLLVLAVAGFLVTAGVRSDVSTAYVRGVSGAGAPGVLVAGHHLLLVVNQSFLIAAPAMGGCVAVDGSGSQAIGLCLRTLTVYPGLGAWILPDVSSGEVSFPPVWLLFLLVPFGATLWGGRAASAGARGARERSLRGAGAGVVFAALVLIGQAASAVAVVPPTGEAILRFGADLATVAVPALVWGIGGGVLGTLLPEPSQDPAGRSPPAGAEEDAPPRPTSV